MATKEYKEKTNEELKQLAVDLVEGKIFSDRHLKNQKDLSMVFMPIALGALSNFTDEDIKEGRIEFLYEYLDKAGPTSINGMPCFFSVRYLNRKDTDTMFDYYEEYKALKNEFDKYG